MPENYPVYTGLPQDKLSQLGGIEDINIPPEYLDTNWDYCTVFKSLVYVCSRVNYIIFILAGTDKASPETNAKLDKRLEELITYIEAIRKKLK